MFIRLLPSNGGELLAVVIMLVGPKAVGDVNAGGVVNPDVGDGVGRPVLTEGGGLVSSPFSDEVLLEWLGGVVVVGEL